MGDDDNATRHRHWLLAGKGFAGSGFDEWGGCFQERSSALNDNCRAPPGLHWWAGFSHEGCMMKPFAIAQAVAVVPPFSAVAGDNISCKHARIDCLGSHNDDLDGATDVAARPACQHGQNRSQRRPAFQRASAWGAATHE